LRSCQGELVTAIDASYYFLFHVELQSERPGGDRSTL
jgi:hypothetical protein